MPPVYPKSHTLRSLVATVVFLLLTIGVATAEEDVVGMVVGAKDKGPLHGVTIKMVSGKDSTDIRGAVSDEDGEFEIEDVPKGVWYFSASFIGFHTDSRILFVRNDEVNVGTISLESDTVTLQSVHVEESVIAVEMSGDTTIFNAKAFKTSKYSSAEDLVKKMPGITVDNGQVTAQGETVKRVLVDGRRFFGDDPQATLKNIPSDMVEKVQVYDAQTDQSKFSGFDDGETDKTLNLVTKQNRRAGQFGKYYGGYGSDQRWSGGATHNYFDGPQRLTILGLTNNINQQNFSITDILSSMGMSGRMGRGMARYAGAVGASTMLSRSGGGGFSNLFVDDQNGVTTTHMLGTNTSLELADGIDLDGSYLFNYADNDNSSVMDRTYVEPEGQLYQENTVATSINRSHRINLRLDAEIDSVNSLLFTPRATLQNVGSTDGAQGLMTNDGFPLSTTETINDAASNAATAAGNLIYRHRFAKGRVFSASTNANWNDADVDASLDAENMFQGIDSTIFLDQISRQTQNGLTLGGSVSYTEPFREKDQLFVRYRGSNADNTLDKLTASFDSLTGDYTIIEPALTNAFDNTWTTHTGDVRYTLSEDKTNLTFGLAYQGAQLSSMSTFPTTVNIDRTYSNFLPNFQWRQKFTMASDIRLSYNTSISPPSASQLQNVVDNTNPLQLSLGNPELEQTYTHRLFVRFKDINWMVGKTLFGFVSGSVADGYIGTETIVTSRDTVVNGIRLPPGATITRPVNLTGQARINSYFTYGFPIKFVESNLNLNAGVNYTRTPGLVNGAKNISNNTSITGGFYWSSNISEDLDISASYRGNYNIVINTLQRDQDANYFTHTASGRMIWNLGIIACSTDVNHSMYTGLGPDFDRAFTVWNAGLGYRFMPEDQAELRITVFDILRQNDAVSRDVNSISIENTINQVITQYVMVSFSYDLRTFKGSPPGRQSRRH